MNLRPLILATCATAGLAACSLGNLGIPGLPNVPEAPALASTGFDISDPLPAGQPVPTANPSTTPTTTVPTLPAALPVAADVMGPASSDSAPFTDARFASIATTTKFKPQFAFTIDATKVNAQPPVVLDIYQTAKELEVKEIRALVERATFRYDKLKVGLQVGSGQMDVGTPPKANLEVKIVCSETDGKSYGLFTAKAWSPFAIVYLSDIKIQDAGGNLQIVSVSNFARGNDHVDQHTTDYSGRVRQQFDAGYLLLSSVPGELRSRVLIYSEGDPKQDAKQALTVIRQAITLTP